MGEKIKDQLLPTPLFFIHQLRRKGGQLGNDFDRERIPLSNFTIEDPDVRIANSQILFAQNTFKQLTIKRPGKPQRFQGGDTSIVKKLLMVRKIEEIENNVSEVRIGELSLLNFTLQTPINDIAINRILEVRKLHLAECSTFALNVLFAFFLKQDF